MPRLSWWRWRSTANCDGKCSAGVPIPVCLSKKYELAHRRRRSVQASPFEGGDYASFFRFNGLNRVSRNFLLATLPVKVLQSSFQGIMGFLPNSEVGI